MNDNLKILRKIKALSLSDLQQISGVDRITIYRIEKGKQTARPRTLRKLAKALQVEVEELFDTSVLEKILIRRKS